jgi:hypothetical protein
MLVGSDMRSLENSIALSSRVFHEPVFGKRVLRETFGSESMPGNSAKSNLRTRRLIAHHGCHSAVCELRAAVALRPCTQEPSSQVCHV